MNLIQEFRLRNRWRREFAVRLRMLSDAMLTETLAANREGLARGVADADTRIQLEERLRAGEKEMTRRERAAPR